ncbi:MAG: hypothetical protein NVS2B11_08270 [Acetobacteraceae bacterium]
MDGYNYFQNDITETGDEMVNTRQVLRTALLMTVASAALVITVAIGIEDAGLSPAAQSEFSTLPVSG